MTIGSLFSGIGGLELGLACLGDVVWQVEIDPGCRAVLERHWPGVARHDDVRTFHPTAVDLVCGGFPCQPFSSANVKSRGRGSMWPEFDRVVGEASPSWVVIENSPQWQCWVPRVRSDLWARGYATLPVLLCPSWLGAPHARPRVFVVAHADRKGELLRAVDEEVARLSQVPSGMWHGGAAPSGGFRMADGVRGRVGECRRYGNAVVPQVAAVIGEAIRRVAA